MTKTDDEIIEEIQMWEHKCIDYRGGIKYYGRDDLKEAISKARQSERQSAQKEFEDIIKLVESLDSIIYSRGNGQFAMGEANWEKFCKEFKELKSKLKSATTNEETK